MQLKSSDGRAITPVSTLEFPDTSSQGSSPDHHYAKRMLDIKPTAFDETDAADRWQHTEHGCGLLAFMLEPGEQTLIRELDPVHNPSFRVKGANAIKLAANGIHGLGSFAKESTQQSAFLRHINHNLEDRDQMLNFLEHYQWLLDPVNRVTCVYRLAKMFTSHPVRQDPRWKADLAANEGFQRLLRGLASQLLTVWLDVQRIRLPPLSGNKSPASSPGHMSNGMRIPSPEAVVMMDVELSPPSQKNSGGADYARCLSNLIWALVKLELVEKQDATAANLIMDITPLVLHYIPKYNSQGIANIIWSYAKLPAPPVTAVLKLLQHMSDMLNDSSSARGFDAQALSNSIWAAAHMSSRGVVHMDGDECSALSKFLRAVATNATEQLGHLEFDRPRYQAHQYLKVTETKFSCQALVNIAWSFATLISGNVRNNPSINLLFQHIRTEAIFRLRTLRSIMENGDMSVARSSGSFNEQALSNLVFAYEKVELLDSELLVAVFQVAMLRLLGLQSSIVLKPQEVCTLLRAARMEGSEAMRFVNTLRRLLDSSPQVTSGWTDAERQEVSMAMTAAAAHQQLHHQRAEVAAAAAAEEVKRHEELQLQQHLQQEAQRRQQQQQHRLAQQRQLMAQHQQQNPGMYDGMLMQTQMSAAQPGVNGMAAQSMWQQRPASPMTPNEAYVASLAMGQQAPPTMMHMTDALPSQYQHLPQASLPQYSMGMPSPMQQQSMNMRMGVPSRMAPGTPVKRPAVPQITGQVLRASYAPANPAAMSPRPQTVTWSAAQPSHSSFTQMAAGPQQVLMQPAMGVNGINNQLNTNNMPFASPGQMLEGAFNLAWQR